jgi:hypothetical protein
VFRTFADKFATKDDASRAFADPFASKSVLWVSIADVEGKKEARDRDIQARFPVIVGL